MTKKEFLKLYEELKNKYEGQEERALDFDNLIQSTFNTNYSMFDSNYDLYNANFSYYIELEDEEDVWLVVDYNITGEGSNSLDSDIRINEIYVV